MLTPCRSKVTFVLALDPLQKQCLGHSLFSDSLQKQSHNLHLFSRLPAEAKSPLFEFVDMLILCKCKITFVLALDPLQKQGLGHHLLFDSLQKQSHNHHLLFTPPRKQSHNHSSGSSTEARSPHFFLACDLTQTKSVSLSLLNFYFDNTNFSQTFHIIM